MERTHAHDALWQRMSLASLASLFAFGSAAVHLWVMPDHFQEWWGYGAFFLALAAVQALYGLGLLLPQRRFSASFWYLLAGILGSLLVMELYVLSRSLGIPAVGPHAGHTEQIDGLGLLSKGLELGLVVCLSILLLRLPDLGRQLWSKARTAVAASLVVAIALLAASLAGPAGQEEESNFSQVASQISTAQASEAASQVGPLNVIRQYDVGSGTSRDVPASYLTINVEVTDEGYVPASIAIPTGQRVQLILRNRGTAEHHYRVLGLAPEGLVFLAAPEDEAPAEAPAGVSDGEHGQHHSGDGDGAFVPSRAMTTPAGVRVTGERIHAWAESGGLDTVIFTATKPGTFDVSDPRHPEIVGKLIVS